MTPTSNQSGDPEPFDLLDPLPDGRSTTMLEASAGTGKTFTVGALVARYVAEGVATLDEMLVITFGRAASQELRERVRSSSSPPSGRSPIRRRSARTTYSSAISSSDDVTLRHKRISDALADFDARDDRDHPPVLPAGAALPRRGRRHRLRRELVDNLDELVVEVVDDLYLRQYGSDAEPPPFKRAVALQLARAAVGDPQAELAPTDAEPGSAAKAKVDFAEPVRAEMERRKHRRGVLSYDDLLSRLADALEDGRRTGARTDAPALAAWCWSTSSRTPTRCSGTCSTARSPATRRWC